MNADVDSRVYGYICHRGYHLAEDVPENSLAAFQEAKKRNLAFETDVHVTKDNELIINHDSMLSGIGAIETHTLSEIRDGYLLPNGENLPTFKETLDAIDEAVPMVLELKIPDGADPSKLAKKVIEEAGAIKDKSKLVIISFSLEALSYFNGSGFARGLLVSGNLNTDLFKSLSKKSLGNDYCDFYDISYDTIRCDEARDYRKRGGKLIGWTFKNQATLDSYKNDCDGYTFDEFEYVG